MRYRSPECAGTDMPPLHLTPKEMLLRRTRVEGYCWVWTGKRKRGYGYVGRHVNGKRHTFMAHRLSYELFKGPIPAQLHIDHVCCNRACVNPDHLDAVTPEENYRRQLARMRIRALTHVSV